MAKITKEMVVKMNGQLANGFQTNIQQLMMGDKVAIKKVVLDENQYLVASLWFGNDYENYRKISNTIDLNISLYTKDSSNDVYVSHGLGHNITLEKGLARKTWKQLVHHSKEITEATILDAYRKYRNNMITGRIV